MGAQEAQALQGAASELAPVAAPRSDVRRRRISSLFGRATELGAFREGQHSLVAMERDARFRRALAAADMLAVTLGLAVVLTVGGALPRPGALVLLPLVVAIAKVAGLYDRDENLLSKTTLDELPALFQLATIYALLVWLGEHALVSSRLGRPAVALLWCALALGLPLARAVARRLVLRSTAPERCLVLGDQASAEQLAAKLAQSTLTGAEVVGYIPLRGNRAWTSEPRREGKLPLLGSVTNLPVALWEHRIERVVIDSSTTPTSDRLLDKIRLIKSVGVKVSLLPRLLEVVGSAATYDDLDGLPGT